MPKYYGQYGEDFILDLLLGERRSGFFVEVGCIDGRRFSNTLTFEERGWKGLCVEAHPAYIQPLHRNRPRSIICHCAAGEIDAGEATLHAYPRGTFSTLVHRQKEYFMKQRGASEQDYEQMKVPMRRLDSLFQEHGITEIDILSLDIEGYEVEALRGIDFRRYQPHVLVVESDDPGHEQRLDDILLPAGYTKSIRVHQNIFYLRDPTKDRLVRNRSFRVSVTHTGHPLDQAEDVHRTVVVDTRSETIRRLARILSGKPIRERIGRTLRRVKQIATRNACGSGSEKNHETSNSNSPR